MSWVGRARRPTRLDGVEDQDGPDKLSDQDGHNDLEMSVRHNDPDVSDRPNDPYGRNLFGSVVVPD